MMGFLSRLREDPLHRSQPTLVVVMVSRLLLLLLLLAVLAALLPFTGASQPFYIFVGLAFVVTIPFSLWLRNDSALSASMPAQFIVDVLVITGLVHFTGGIRSDLSILYPLVILVAGIVVSGWLATRVALFSIVLYTGVILLEMEGLLSYRGAGVAPYGDPPQVIRDLMLRVLIFCFFTLAAGFISDRCLAQDGQLRRLRGLGQILFNTVKAPLLGVSRTGRIVLSNDAAVHQLGAGLGQPLHGRDLASLFTAGTSPSAGRAGNDDGPRMWEMRRLDGTTFSALVEVARAVLPTLGEQFPGLGGETHLQLVVFQDMSRLAATPAPSAGDSLAATAGMVAEIAHEVRNPLTAIRGAGELLSETAGAVAKERRSMTTDDWSLVNSLCEVISEETRRLDASVQGFMDAAEHDTESLAGSARSAEEWLRKLPIYGKKNAP